MIKINYLALAAAFLISSIIFYQTGRVMGVQQSRASWQASLIEKGFAEYDRKTAEWGYRQMDDIVQTHLIERDFPLPKTEPEIQP